MIPEELENAWYELEEEWQMQKFRSLDYLYGNTTASQFVHETIRSWNNEGEN